jgi:hypothetical protein
MSSIDPSIGHLAPSVIQSEGAPPVEGAAVAPVSMPTNPAALVEIVARGLAPDADAAARDAAWQVWTRFSPLIIALTRSMPMPGAVPPGPVPVGTEAIAAPRLTPVQIGDLLIEKLRSRLPPGTELPEQRGFNVRMLTPK